MFTHHFMQISVGSQESRDVGFRIVVFRWTGQNLMNYYTLRPINMSYNDLYLNHHEMFYIKWCNNVILR